MNFRSHHLIAATIAVFGAAAHAAEPTLASMIPGATETTFAAASAAAAGHSLTFTLVGEYTAGAPTQIFSINGSTLVFAGGDTNGAIKTVNTASLTKVTLDSFTDNRYPNKFATLGLTTSDSSTPVYNGGAAKVYKDATAYYFAYEDKLRHQRQRLQRHGHPNVDPGGAGTRHLRR